MAALSFDAWETYAQQFEEMTDKLSVVVAPVIEQLEKEGEKLGAMAAPLIEQLERHARVMVEEQAERALDMIDTLREHLERFVATGDPEDPSND